MHSIVVRGKDQSRPDLAPLSQNLGAENRHEARDAAARCPARETMLSDIEGMAYGSLPCHQPGRPMSVSIHDRRPRARLMSVVGEIWRASSKDAGVQGQRECCSQHYAGEEPMEVGPGVDH